MLSLLQIGIQGGPEPWTSTVIFIAVFIVVYFAGRFTLHRLTSSFAAKYAPWAESASSLASRAFIILLALSAGLTGAGWYSARFLIAMLGVLLVGILLGGIVWFESILRRNKTDTR